MVSLHSTLVSLHGTLVSLNSTSVSLQVAHVAWVCLFIGISQGFLPHMPRYLVSHACCFGLHAFHASLPGIFVRLSKFQCTFLLALPHNFDKIDAEG